MTFFNRQEPRLEYKALKSVCAVRNTAFIKNKDYYILAFMQGCKEIFKQIWFILDFVKFA